MAKLDKGKPKPNGKANVKGKAAGSAPSSKGKQRQRDDPEQDADPVEEAAAAAPSIDLDKVAKKMHHALRQVHTAAKRSKQFEIQRLIKRSKAGPSSSSSSTDPAPPIAESIEAQMHEIKSMDLNGLAASALLNKLAKAKLLPKGEAAEPFKTDEAMKDKTGVEEWPLLHGVWEDETLALAWTSTRVSQSAPAEDTAAKARAKLLSNKVLAEETAKAVEALGKLVATKPQTQISATDGAQAVSTSKEQAKSKGETSSLAKAKPAETAEEPDREWSGSEDGGEGEDDVEKVEAAGASEGESDDESDEDDEGLDEEAIQERVAQLGDLDQWDHLIGGSDSDEGEDDGNEDNDEGSPDEGDAEPRAVTASSASDAKKRKRSASPEAQRKGKKKVAVAAPAAAKTSSSDTDASDDDDNDDDSASDAESSASSSSSSSSRYLPTLSHGFVTQSLRTRDDDFSGSEDEGDYDFEEDVEDHLPKGKGTKTSNGAAKKNRMGQRARKALWEKKYGRNANHVKLREKEKSSSKGERPGAFKPLRRGRDGKVLEEFVEPERKDSGWKRFPIKEDAASAKASSSSRAAPPPARGGHRGAPPARPPRQQQQQRPPPPADRPRGPAPSSAASDAAAMHPSWVAKQKQKEKEEAIARSLAGGGGGAGKKVVFD